jgi:hypothetical protein
MRWFIAVVVLAAPLAAFADSSHCYNIQDSDKRAFCLVSIEKKTSYCYNIKAQDLKNQCLAGVG